jgi:hypothetical protein
MSCQAQFDCHTAARAKGEEYWVWSFYYNRGEAEPGWVEYQGRGVYKKYVELRRIFRIHDFTPEGWRECEAEVVAEHIDAIRYYKDDLHAEMARIKTPPWIVLSLPDASWRKW